MEEIGILFAQLDSREVLENELMNHKNSRKDVLVMYVGYSDGTSFICDGWIPVTGWTPTVRPWYIGAIALDGQVFVSSPFLDLISNEMVITLAVYIGEVEGVQAVIGMDLRL